MAADTACGRMDVIKGYGKPVIHGRAILEKESRGSKTLKCRLQTGLHGLF